MPDISTFTSAGPYHIISYGTLLGTEVFQSFIAGVQAYRVLPRPQFATLQSALFPIYFSMQTALPLVLALTYPGERTVAGTENVGPAGIFAEGNRFSVLLPLITILATSAANLAIVGPATTKVMRDRKHQETRDGKKSYDSPPHSKEMMALNKRFAKLHGVSSLLNMAGCIATVSYGFTLGERFQ